MLYFIYTPVLQYPQSIRENVEARQTNNGGAGNGQADDGMIPLVMSARPGMMKRRRALSDSISEGKFTKEAGSHPRLKNSDVE